jgi:hypothetical protein
VAPGQREPPPDGAYFVLRHPPISPGEHAEPEGSTRSMTTAHPLDDAPLSRFHKKLALYASGGHSSMATCCPSSAWPSHLALASEVPWGGFKGSGYRRDLSLYALDDYSRTKHIMHNHTR